MTDSKLRKRQRRGQSEIKKDYGFSRIVCEDATLTRTILMDANMAELL